MKSQCHICAIVRLREPALRRGMGLSRTWVLTALLAMVVVCVPPAPGAPPTSRSFADAIRRLADTSQPLQIDSWDELLAWREVLMTGPTTMGSPGTAGVVRNDLVRLLARRQPILQGSELELATPVSPLERLQMATLPTVAASGDRSYLPALQALYRQQMQKGNWHLVEEIRPVIRALNGDAPSRPIYEGPAYYQWLKQQGYYRTIQSLSSEADLEEHTPSGLTRLYIPPTVTNEAVGGAEYDGARALRILAALSAVVSRQAFDENLVRWIQFGGTTGSEFRLSWARNDVRYYLGGVGDEPRVLVVLLDERFQSAAALQARLAEIFGPIGLALTDLPTEGRDIAQPVGSGRVLIGQRSYRQGRFTVVRFEVR